MPALAPENALDPARAEPIVRGVVAAKAANQRAVLRRALRDQAKSLPPDAAAALAAAEARLTDVARRTLKPGSVAALRGLDGEAAAACLAVFDALVRVDGPAFRFPASVAGRSQVPIALLCE